MPDDMECSDLKRTSVIRSYYLRKGWGTQLSESWLGNCRFRAPARTGPIAAWAPS
jgi:hypothetical protein